MKRPRLSWHALRRGSRAMMGMEHGARLLPSSKTARLVEVLAFLLGSVPKTASSAGLRRELSCAIDRTLSGVWLPDEDFADHRHMAAMEAGGLHVCPQCGSMLVQPVRWEPNGKPGHWHIWRRCPECEWATDGVHNRREANAFRDALQSGTDILTAQLEEQERHGIGNLLELFSYALAADLITADDFRRRY